MSPGSPKSPGDIRFHKPTLALSSLVTALSRACSATRTVARRRCLGLCGNVERCVPDCADRSRLRKWRRSGQPEAGLRKETSVLTYVESACALACLDGDASASRGDHDADDHQHDRERGEVRRVVAGFWESLGCCRRGACWCGGRCRATAGVRRGDHSGRSRHRLGERSAITILDIFIIERNA
jgi:hypothetical protein